MAKLLAKHGVSVTIVVTPLNAARSSSVIDRAVATGLSIRLLQIRFPAEAAGLPPGCESADCLPSYHFLRNFFAAINMLQQPLEEILIDLKPSPSCIICDKHISWTADTCNKFQIPRIIFDGMSCFAQLIMHRLYFSKIHETVSPSELFAVPDLPDKIEFTKLQLPGYFNPGSVDIGDFREQVWKTESQAYGVVVNTFKDLEKRYLDEYRKIKGGKVWSIGPLSLFSNDDLDRAERGNQASIDADQCLNWLDNREPGSVIYACLGSLSRLSPDQFVELASGLEISNHPFILVIKGGAKSEEIEKWILDSGFEERTKERGVLIRGGPHKVFTGLPMITWPIFAEQFLNEKLVVQILGTGVGVGARVVIHLGEEEKDENKVKRDEIKSAIEMVMDEGEKGCERRKRAKKVGEMAKRSMEEGGSSYLNIGMLIQEIAQLGNSKHGIE
ncbi:hypothetical protein DH2020_026206 [Rehmannia glutinosa]|uniref:UDP-glycosyltransferase n=1 Tax=Rehmannia glutinosa TaxID=99300 RepID=A0ABR0W0G5_REHGL